MAKRSKRKQKNKLKQSQVGAAVASSRAATNASDWL